MTTTLTLPSGTKFRTATQRRYVLVHEGRERLERDLVHDVCSRCGGALLRGHGAHISAADGERCYNMGPSTGVSIVKRSDSVDVLRKARKSAAMFIMDTVTGEVVR